MRILRTKKWAVLIAFVVGGAIGASAAIAAVTTTVAADTNTVRERIAQISTDGGFDSGWHIHPGVAIVQVQQGSFQITQGSCTPTTVSAGQTFIEVPHLAVRAVTTGHVEWTTTLITDSHNSPQVAWTQYSPGAKDPCS